MQILTVVGARPQFIKAAVVSLALAEEGVKETLVHTGQHYDAAMSSVFFTELGLPEPELNLGVAEDTHGAMTGQMLVRLEKAMAGRSPDCVLVYGDTNSTLAAALAAAKLGVDVAHVEAGLRSFDRSMPEEINRVVSDHVAKWHFCPTRTGVENLAREGIAGDGVLLVGDVMCDAALRFRNRARKPDAAVPDACILATLHRPVNVDDPARLAGLLAMLEEVGAETTVVLPLHPRTARRMQEAGLTAGDPNRLLLLPALGYLEMLWLLDRCRLVVTDSGGVQKEAYYFGKPCVTLRSTTEWVELVEFGASMLAGGEIGSVALCIEEMQQRIVKPDVDLYGGGRSAQRIARFLAKKYGSGHGE